ncbi:MAG: hypothetical protein V2B15_01115 [Bacteroidota bacterium]
MKKFAARLLLFTILFLLVNKGYTLLEPDSDVKEADQRLSYLLSGNMNKDVIITGASSGSAGIMAERIEDETGLTAYNLCYLGSNVEFHEFMVRALVEFNDPPKILLLVIDDSIEFKTTTRVNYKEDQLYPMIKNKFVREELVNRVGKGKLVSDLVVFFRSCNFNVDRKLKRFDNYLPYLECGSRPIPVSFHKGGIDWAAFSNSNQYSRDDEAPGKLSAYQHILSICHDHGIIPVVVMPPIYPAGGDAFQNRVRQAGGDGVHFFIYDKENPIYSNSDYYYDNVHLRRNGADIFTNEIIRFIVTLQ